MVTSSTDGVIGRMLGRRNLAGAYNEAERTRTAREDAPGVSGAGDRVELSPHAPRPIGAAVMDSGLAAADKLRSGQPLSDTERAAATEDGVYRAMIGLLALRPNGDIGPSDWPPGIPAPSMSEVEAARRRLSQRIVANDADAAETAKPLEVLNHRRMEALDAVRGKTTASLAQYFTALAG